MNTLSFDLQSMYGDHHVTEVRYLLLELDGVDSVYASSGFQFVEIEYDEAKVDAEAIKVVLDEAGYLGELPISVEQGAIEDRENGQKPFFRKSVSYEQTGRDISFAQQVPFSGRPLWPCPGMGLIEQVEEEMTNG